jgi:hypothetical protein
LELAEVTGLIYYANVAWISSRMISNLEIMIGLINNGPRFDVAEQRN